MANPILITGCSSGIGRATAERLAAAGHTVYATARRLESIADLEAKGCRLLALDVTDEASMAAAVAEVTAREGHVFALVNNAGYGQYGPIEEVPLAEVRREFETNVFGLMRLTQLVLPGMRGQRRGRIVNVGSMGGRLTFPGGGAYHASKYAVEAITDALRFETRGFGIKVSLIEPGFIKTGFGDTAVASTGTEGEPDGPYAAFNRASAKNIHDAYEGSLSRLARGPEAVAAAIEHALTAKRPRTRYLVAPSAHLLVRTRRWLPDPLWDAFLRRSYPTPR
jgi:NAD(P)-dependent dehydrogenase (short-subunit alcohol dehydrogenase family)